MHIILCMKVVIWQIHCSERENQHFVQFTSLVQSDRRVYNVNYFEDGSIWGSAGNGHCWPEVETVAQEKCIHLYRDFNVKLLLIYMYTTCTVHVL